MDGLSQKQLQLLALCEQAFAARSLSTLSATDLLGFCSRLAKIQDVYLQKHRPSLTPLKIAIVASWTVHHLALMLKAFLYELSVAPEIHIAPYDSINSQLLDPASSVHAFKPDVMILMPQDNGAGSFPSLVSTDQEFDAWATGVVGHQRRLWAQSSLAHRCQIIQCLSPSRPFRQLGNLESYHPRSHKQCLRELERRLIADRPSNVIFFDLDHLASWLGHDRWVDEVNYFISKQPMSFDAMKLVASGLSRLLATYAGKSRKCLVLDLDNTLWGGVIGDDGLRGITLGNGDPLGEAFLAFQAYVKSLRDRGILLAVCSKNQDAIARTPFASHPEMRLKEDDIVCFVANFDDKATNLRLIARQLNIGLDSLVFFDDNPVERDLVRQFAPQVQVIEAPQDPAHYIRALDAAMCFERSDLTQEDLDRSQTYKADAQRKELQDQATDYPQFLISLDMHADVKNPGPVDLPRFLQLINKSNQFNLRTRRYTSGQLDALALTPGDAALIGVRLADRFSDYGLISSIILLRDGPNAFIDTWVMSCRVLNRHVEDLVFNAMASQARQWGCLYLTGQFIPTPKNAMVQGLLPSLGFEPYTPGPDTPDPGSPDPGSHFRLPVSQCPLRPHPINLSSKQPSP